MKQTKIIRITGSKNGIFYEEQRPYDSYELAAMRAESMLKLGYSTVLLYSGGEVIGTFNREEK